MGEILVGVNWALGVVQGAGRRKAQDRAPSLCGEGWVPREWI